MKTKDVEEVVKAYDGWRTVINEHGNYIRLSEKCLDELKKQIRNDLTSRDTYWKEQMEGMVEDCRVLYEALEDMWNQYCPEPYGHMFMSAGENCEEVLETYSKYKRTDRAEADITKEG